MSPAEYDIWMEYFKVEPFGEYGHYYRAASVAAMLFNIQVSKEKDRVAHLGDVFPTVFPVSDAHKKERTQKAASALIAGAVRVSSKADLERVVGSSVSSRVRRNAKVGETDTRRQQ